MSDHRVPPDQSPVAPGTRPGVPVETAPPTPETAAVSAPAPVASDDGRPTLGTRPPKAWRSRRLSFALFGEFVGTFILVFFGIGAIHAAVATGAQVGLWQVAVVWAVGVSLGIYAASSLSGAHINPAITLMAAVYDGFPWRRVVPFVASQLAGAAAAALVLYGLFAEMIAEFERVKGLVRGGPGSELSAMMYGEYFPNPALFGTSLEAYRVVTPLVAFAAEAVGTAFLAFFVSALTHPRNAARPSASAAPLMIGLVVAAIISVIAPLTQAGLNPARDFGPRLVAYFLGWGAIAIPGPRGGWLTVYIVGPLVGGLVGGGAYRLLAMGMVEPRWESPGAGPSRPDPVESRRRTMAEYQILYWMDIPSVVEARDGAGTARVQLSQRFQDLIDAVAMKEKLAGTDAYLDQWEKGAVETREGTAGEVARAVAAELEAGYSVLKARKLA